MTRFRDWPAGLARSVLAATLALMALGLVLSANPLNLERYTVDPSVSDTALYEAVARRVSQGEGYYAAAFAEHRARGYPLKPFVTVRLPTLAWINAVIGPDIALWVLRLLVVGGMVAVCLRMRDVFKTRLAQAGVAICAAFGAVVLAEPRLVVWHEVWAALLISLSLFCRGDKRYVASLLFGLAAASIRELAVPYLLVMAVIALFDRRPGEALAWAAGLLVVLAGIALHAMEVSRLVLDTDKASPGWASFGGWKLVLTMVQDSSLLSEFHLSAAAVVVPLALLGWAAWKGPSGTRGFLALAGYCCAFMVLGRDNNTYWGALLAPVIFVGLAFVPAALSDLVRAARGEGRARAPTGSIP